MHAIDAREQRNAFGAALFIHTLLAAGLFVSLSWGEKPQPVVQVELWGSPPVDRPSPTPSQPTREPKTASKTAPAPEPKADISLQKKREAEKKAEQAKAAERKAAAEKAAQKKLEEQRAAQQREAVRKAELARLLSTDSKAKPNDRGKDIATKAGASEGAEIGAKTGVDADYVALIQARIRARITYADRAPGNPEAIVIVDQLPSGEITKVRLAKSSGIAAWDDAVQRAIWAANPLPKKKDGTVVRTLELRFRPKEAP